MVMTKTFSQLSAVTSAKDISASTKTATSPNASPSLLSRLLRARQGGFLSGAPQRVEDYRGVRRLSVLLFGVSAVLATLLFLEIL